MSTQSQLPATRNPLALPNILENIFNYLPTTCLVRLTYVNKMWRLEARHKLYQNRGEIIYKELEWFLESYRRHWGTPLIRLLGYQKSVSNVVKFLKSFNLNFKVELLLIRDQLKKQHEAIFTILAEKFQASEEAERLFRQDHRNTEKYNNYRKLQNETETVSSELFYESEALWNFEHFLIRYNVITHSNELTSLEMYL